ncbi:MAG: ABC transporter ATP-binding protein [Lachnospiraceae bacterium]|nr:ABC transporter ATP-binding protein [Lachnospiraceae bacterium]
MAGHPHGRPMMRQPGEKTDFKSMKKMLVYCKRYMPAVIVAVILAIGGSYATIIGPEYISDLTNEIIAGMMMEINMSAVRDIAVKLLVIYIAGALLSYGQQFITATVTQHAARRLRNDIDGKINRLPLRFFDTSTKGDLLSRVTNDVDTISQTLAQSTANLLGAIVLLVGVMIKMFGSSVILSFVTIAAAMLGFFSMGFIMKKSQKYFNRKQEDLGTLNGQIEEVYTNHNIVLAFGGKEAEQEKFTKINDKLYDDNWRSQFLSGLMMPIMSFVGNLSYVLIFAVGIAFIIKDKGGMSFGTISAFIIYSRLFQQPLGTFAQSMTSIQQASAASKRVFEILEAHELSDESKKTMKLAPEKVRGDVEFSHVKFGYLPDKTIIHDFSAKLTAGQKVAIVGPTGAGKTTMVNLLMRFYEPDAGDIKIDGVSIRDITRENVHDLFDMILQDTWLFGGTIRENLVYNKVGVTEAELDEVCTAVGLKHFIDTLDKGYDTELSDTLSLSEGQKQQLTIARAMLKDAPLLILDEATSSVDTRTELVIQRAMDELTKDRTSFVIAHRLSTIKNADIILVMRDGDIVEQGNHKDLLEQEGFYAELYNSQFVTT